VSILKELSLFEEKDLTELPYDVVHDLEQHINKGAKDLDVKIANALELVKSAYEVENVEMPDPSMKKGWIQFSKLLEYATQKLVKFRGLDGDWRMSANTVMENLSSVTSYSFRLVVNETEEHGKVDAYDVEDVVEVITEKLEAKLFKVYTTQVGGGVKIELYDSNIKQPITIFVNA